MARVVRKKAKRLLYAEFCVRPAGSRNAGISERLRKIGQARAEHPRTLAAAGPFGFRSLYKYSRIRKIFQAVNATSLLKKEKFFGGNGKIEKRASVKTARRRPGETPGRETSMKRSFAGDEGMEESKSGKALETVKERRESKRRAQTRCGKTFCRAGRTGKENEKASANFGKRRKQREKRGRRGG